MVPFIDVTQILKSDPRIQLYFTLENSHQFLFQFRRVAFTYFYF